MVAPNNISEPCDCYAEEAVGPHTTYDHSDDCGYARHGRTDQACGGCYGCISAQVSWAHYQQSVEARRDTCQSCGQYPADGYAYIEDKRYCHGDDEFVTCYMRVNFQNWDVLEDWFEPE